MDLSVDIYYENKRTGEYHIFHEIITEDDIAKMIKEKKDDERPLWMGEDWEFNSINIDKIDL